MADRLKPGTKAHFDRQRVHAHNMKLGGARMMHIWAQTIMTSESSTAESKAIAAQIYMLSGSLYQSLKTRKDPAP